MFSHHITFTISIVHLLGHYSTFTISIVYLLSDSHCLRISSSTRFLKFHIILKKNFLSYLLHTRLYFINVRGMQMNSDQHGNHLRAEYERKGLKSSTMGHVPSRRAVGTVVRASRGQRQRKETVRRDSDPLGSTSRGAEQRSRSTRVVYAAAVTRGILSRVSAPADAIARECVVQ